MKKKILIFSLAYYPSHIGGAEVAIKEITDRLSPDDYEFHLVCNRYDSNLPKVEKIGNVKVHRIGWATSSPSMADLRKFPLHLNKLIYQFQAYWFAKKLHKKEKFDGIWAMMAHATGVPAAKFKRAFPEVKFILTLQEGDPPEVIERKMRPLKKDFDAAFKTADVIQVISSFLGNWAKKKGCKNEPVLIPNAVDIAHFTQIYSEDELQKAKNELGKKAGDVFLVTTSRLVHKNAIDDVIRALPKLSEKVKFVVFGTGPDEVMLHDLAKELGVAERVLFKGHIDHSDMPKYLKACDIFIRPSRSEGMGNSFIEAMAAELPVIATQVGGISDFLFDAKLNPKKEATGWAVDPDSPDQIVEAVKKILDRPELAATTVQTAHNLTTSKYDWNLITKDMEEYIFDSV